MHVIWKRPDGFHGAMPSDFFVAELDSHSRLWLHKTDKEQYPFRISGGWEERGTTKRLNGLVNLLAEPKEKWLMHLSVDFSHSPLDSAAEYIDGIHGWLIDLKQHLKGDTWELEIMNRAIECTAQSLMGCRDDFIASASKNQT